MRSGKWEKKSIAILSTLVEEAGTHEDETSTFSNQIDMPESATHFYIQSGKLRSNEAELSDNTQGLTVIEIYAKKQSWSGFKRAIGVRGIETYEIQIRMSEREVVTFNNYSRYTESRQGRHWFEWRVFVDEQTEKIAQVEQVMYRLHPTFQKQVHTITDRNSQFALMTKGWGEFWIQATIFFVDGKKEETQYYLDLGKP